MNEVVLEALYFKIKDSILNSFSRLVLPQARNYQYQKVSHLLPILEPFIG